MAAKKKKKKKKATRIAKKSPAAKSKVSSKKPSKKPKPQARSAQRPAKKSRQAPKKTTTAVSIAKADAGLAEKTRLPELSHHAVSPREMEKIAHDGLRSEGEILHVEENEFAPC